MGKSRQNMLEIILYVLSIAYITRLLLLNESRGPFESDLKYIVWDHNGETYSRPVNLFDRFRRLFHVYSVKDYVWNVRENNTAYLWGCPYCLSFRINLVLLLIYSIISLEVNLIVVLLIFSVPEIAGRLNE